MSDDWFERWSGQGVDETLTRWVMEAEIELGTLETRIGEDESEMVTRWADAMSALNDAKSLDPIEPAPLRICLHRALAALADLEPLLPFVDDFNAQGAAERATFAIREALRLVG